MSNLYRGTSIDASYQVSYHLAKWLQRKSCFRNRPIRNKNCLWRPLLLTDQNGMSNSHRCFLPCLGPFGQAFRVEGPPIDASYQVSVHLAKWFQRRRFFRNQTIRNKNCLWWPCLLTDRDEMSNRKKQKTFHRCFLPSFGSFGQTVSEKNLKNQPIRNKNRLWRPCLLTDRDGMSNLYRGPSIDDSYQVSDHLAKQFQRRRFLEINQSETRIACGGHVC
jgi:hypothetical protein